MNGFLALLAVGLALYWSAVVGHIARSLRRPPRRTYATAVARGVPGDPSELPQPLQSRSWSFDAGALSLPVWDIALDDRGPVVIITHGWASSRLGALRRIPALAEAGAGRIIAWDLPGHGEAPGLTTLGIREPAALRALIEDLQRQGELRPIVLYGSSMGAGVSIAACAAGAKVAMVIAEAPYRVPQTPAAAVMRERGVPPLGRLRPALALFALLSRADPLWRGFDRAKLAAKVRCPLLVIHGSLDAICPSADGQAIARAAPHGRFISIEGAGHNDLWSEPHAHAAAAAVREGLQQLTGHQMPPPSSRPSASIAEAAEETQDLRHD